MNKDEKINSFGLSTMVVALTSSSFYGIFSSYILYNTENASLISIIIGFIISLIISKVILSFFNKYPNESYINKNKTIFGKFAIIINLISILCAFLAYTLLTYRLTAFLSNQYLIETPNYIISIMIILITYYISSKGMEATIRVATISFFISSLIFIFDFSSLVGQINYQNFLPLITVSTKNILISSIIFAFYFSIPIVYINAVKKSQIADNNKLNKYYYIMICISFLITFLSISTTIGVSGVRINNLFDYPVYTTLKRIKLFSFLDSLENISIMLWVLYIINTCSMILLFMFNNIKEIFKLKQKSSTITNIVIVIISFLIPNMIFNNNDFTESYNYIWIPFIILSMILLTIIISIIKDRLN